MSDFEVCPGGTTARLEAVEAECDALKQALHDEIDANLRLRELGRARSDETMTTFIERLIAERDALQTKSDRAEQCAAYEAWRADKAEAERDALLATLKYAEAALADLGADACKVIIEAVDVAWCEARTAEALPRIRAAIAKAEGTPCA